METEEEITALKCLSLLSNNGLLKILRRLKSPLVPLRFWHVLRLIVGCTFFLSGILKIQKPYSFLSDIYAYEMAGQKLGLLIGIGLPWLELVIGTCLLANVFIEGALLGLFFLGLLFSVVQVAALRKGLNISCGCFLSNSESVGYLSLGRTLSFGIFALVFMIYFGKRSRRIVNPRSGSS